jgi:isopenicillin N synthase-like dioxygenase
MTFPQGIPSVDLADFLSTDPARKLKFVNELGDAYENIGFVSVKNHFLSESLEENLYQQVKAFFTLPIETKEKYEIPGIAGQRGYISFGKEHAKGRTVGDLKEFWHFGQYVDDSDPIKQEYPENVSVSELPEFNLVGKEAYQLLEKTGKYMLRAIAIFLGLNEDYFDEKIHHGNSILRPIFYGPIVNDPKDAVMIIAVCTTTISPCPSPKCSRWRTTRKPRCRRWACSSSTPMGAGEGTKQMGWRKWRPGWAVHGQS